MAPETLRSEVFPASDVWAAGVMAHQLLTGRFPFDDKSNPFSPSLSKVWGSILTDEVRRVGQCGGGVCLDAGGVVCAGMLGLLAAALLLTCNWEACVP